MLEKLSLLPRPLKDFLRRISGLWAPPGHFYSPIPSLREVREDQEAIFNPNRKHFPGIDLNPENQLRLIEELVSLIAGMPDWTRGGKTGLRYRYRNIYFSGLDADILCCMIRKLNPARIVEVGSGFSSALMLDLNELQFGGRIELTLIDPNPQRLKKLVKKGDCFRLLEKRVQLIDPAIFAGLERNDILLIDSSHVSKTGSDVNFLLFEVLPALKPGVSIHFHDIFHPLEYPPEWVRERRAWNEAYLVRSFLQYNQAFAITLFNSYLAHFYPSLLNRFPGFGKSRDSSSLWLQKKH